jgi:Ca-activated chloride channel homolog
MKIELIPEKTHSQRDGGTMHVLIRLHAPSAKPNPKRIPLNLGLVIDRSGSMSGEKLRYAKAAAEYVLTHLEAEDRVSLVAFDDQIEVPLRSSFAHQVKVKAVMETITDRGSTDLHGGWLEGATQVASHQIPNALNRVLLLSDGIANVGETNLERIAKNVQDLAARGISTSALGVGRDFNEDLMQAIAVSGDGNYHFIEHPSQLPHLFATELAGLKNTFSNTVSLGLEVEGGAEVLDVLNDAPQNANGRLMLPSLLYNQTVEVLVKLRLPAGQSIQALRVRLAYNPTDSNKRLVERQSLHLSSVDAATHRTLDSNPQVLEALALLESARAKAEMIAQLDLGNNDSAKEIVQSRLDHLAAMPATSPKILSEIADLETLKTDLTQDLAVSRKRASAQRYEKQRGN